jgi:translation initiation factor 3 subunit E
MDEVLAAVPEDSILPKLAAQLSRHLLFPLIEFEAGKAEEKGDDETAKKILNGKIKLLESTNMADYVANLYCELNGVSEPPQEYAKKRTEVLTQMEKFEQDVAKISELLTRDDVVGGLRSDKVANLEFLKKEHDVSRMIQV